MLKDARRGDLHAVQGHLLRLAQSAGYLRAPALVARIKNEPNLDSLRKRQNFQQLLRELESESS
jgi:hypothetical protein